MLKQETIIRNTKEPSKKKVKLDTIELIDSDNSVVDCLEILSSMESNTLSNRRLSDIDDLRMEISQLSNADTNSHDEIDMGIFCTKNLSQILNAKVNSFEREFDDCDIEKHYIDNDIIIPLGIKNPGNYCYIISIVQALFSTVQLAKQKNLEFIFATFVDHSLMKRVYIDLPKEIIALKPSHFGDNTQEDAQEFLSYLVNNIPIQNFFRFEEHFTLKCKHCSDTELKEGISSYFHMLNVSQNLQKSIREIIEGSVVSDIDDAECIKCQKIGKEQTLLIKNTSENIILYLKIFETVFDGYNVIANKLLFKGVVDDIIVIEEIQFQLYAVVAHGGDSASSGHYIAWAKHGPLWYKFNDHIVTVHNDIKIEIKSSGFIPYLLFYRKYHS